MLLTHSHLCCFVVWFGLFFPFEVTISYLLLSPEQQQPAPAIDGVFGKDWCMDLWREEKVSSQRKVAMEPAAMTSMGAQVSEQLVLGLCVLSFPNRSD